jgi:hypothetical protein
MELLGPPPFSSMRMSLRSDRAYRHISQYDSATNQQQNSCHALRSSSGEVSLGGPAAFTSGIAAVRRAGLFGVGDQGLQRQHGGMRRAEAASALGEIGMGA